MKPQSNKAYGINRLESKTARAAIMRLFDTICFCFNRVTSIPFQDVTERGTGNNVVNTVPLLREEIDPTVEHKIAGNDLLMRSPSG